MAYAFQKMHPACAECSILQGKNRQLLKELAARKVEGYADGKNKVHNLEQDLLLKQSLLEESNQINQTLSLEICQLKKELEDSYSQIGQMSESVHTLNKQIQEIKLVKSELEEVKTSIQNQLNFEKQNALRLQRLSEKDSKLIHSLRTQLHLQCSSSPIPSISSPFYDAKQPSIQQWNDTFIEESSVQDIKGTQVHMNSTLPDQHFKNNVHHTTMSSHSCHTNEQSKLLHSVNFTPYPLEFESLQTVNTIQMDTTCDSQQLNQICKNESVDCVHEKISIHCNFQKTHLTSDDIQNSSKTISEADNQPLSSASVSLEASGCDYFANSDFLEDPFQSFNTFSADLKDDQKIILSETTQNENMTDSSHFCFSNEESLSSQKQLQNIQDASTCAPETSSLTEKSTWSSSPDSVDLNLNVDSDQTLKPLVTKNKATCRIEPDAPYFKLCEFLSDENLAKISTAIIHCDIKTNAFECYTLKKAFLKFDDHVMRLHDSDLSKTSRFHLKLMTQKQILTPPNKNVGPKYCHIHSSARIFLQLILLKCLELFDSHGVSPSENHALSRPCESNSGPAYCTDSYTASKRFKSSSNTSIIGKHALTYSNINKSDTTINGGIHKSISVNTRQIESEDCTKTSNLCHKNSATQLHASLLRRLSVILQTYSDFAKQLLEDCCTCSHSLDFPFQNSSTPGDQKCDFACDLKSNHTRCVSFILSSITELKNVPIMETEQSWLKLDIAWIGRLFDAAARPFPTWLEWFSRKENFELLRNKKFVHRSKTIVFSWINFSVSFMDGVFARTIKDYSKYYASILLCIETFNYNTLLSHIYGLMLSWPTRFQKFLKENAAGRIIGASLLSIIASLDVTFPLCKLDSISLEIFKSYYSMGRAFDNLNEKFQHFLLFDFGRTLLEPSIKSLNGVIVNFKNGDLLNYENLQQSIGEYIIGLLNSTLMCNNWLEASNFLDSSKLFNDDSNHSLLFKNGNECLEQYKILTLAARMATYAFGFQWTLTTIVQRILLHYKKLSTQFLSQMNNLDAFEKAGASLLCSVFFVFFQDYDSKRKGEDACTASFIDTLASSLMKDDIVRLILTVTFIEKGSKQFSAVPETYRLFSEFMKSIILCWKKSSAPVQS